MLAHLASSTQKGLAPRLLRVRTAESSRAQMTHQTFPKPTPRPKKRRKGLRRVSAKREAYQAELDAITPALMERCGGLCEICRAAAPEHRHHRLRRSQGGPNTMANLLFLCDGCHWFVHEYPSNSFAQGWLLRG